MSQGHSSPLAGLRTDLADVISEVRVQASYFLLFSCLHCSHSFCDFFLFQLSPMFIEVHSAILFKIPSQKFEVLPVQ